MSKSLKKLIDTNRLREFKNKLVGAGSAYVQTGAVDQTIAGTKTFSKPIAGSVTGSSGSCTGNADTATTLKTTRTLWGNNFNGSQNLSGTIHFTNDDLTGVVVGTSGEVGVNDCWRVGGGATAIDSGFMELATADNGNEPIYVRQYSGKFTTVTRTATLLDTSGNTQFPGNVTATTFYGTVSGNAATATKLAAKRTIALSGAATGTATAFDGSGNITIPITALAASAIRAQWYAAFPDGAEAHNAMWGGRDITAAFNNGTVSANIANGTFKDIFPGDYITKSVTISGTAYTVNWVIADCDYWINKGDTSVTTAHHVAIVPQAPIFNAQMNATTTTEGGYKGSRMYTETIPACATGIVNAFGSSHILTFRDSITTTVNTSSISSGAPFWTGAASDWGWYDAQCNLMCERMVYGMPAFFSSAWDAGVATRQFSAFRLSERLINYTRWHWWLRDVVSSANFALVYGYGNASTLGASNVIGVRPFALLV